MTSNKYLVIALVVAVISFLIVLIYSVTRIDTEGEFATNLYNMIGSNDLNHCGGLIKYSHEESDISLEYKLCNSMYYKIDNKVIYEEVTLTNEKEYCNIDDISFTARDEDCAALKVSADALNNHLKTVYNITNDDKISFSINEYDHCVYNEVDDYYYCSDKETVNVTYGPEENVYRIIDSVKEKGSNIEITDYFLKIYNEKCYTDYGLKHENLECTNEFVNNSEVTEKFILKYGGVYKHIYKPLDEAYYYSSTTFLN